MMQDELCYLDLIEVGRRIRAREMSSVDVTRAMIDRVVRLDKHLKSYATLAPESALEQAAQADREIARGVDRGPLHGVPVAVKDLCRTRGIATAAGTSIYKGYLPEHDATVVGRLGDAGAVLLGKLQMTEGAFSGYHPSVSPPVNPWSAAHWSGVSSSGSGVATAAGLCFAALGSDTLGSIRFPSAMNGVTGLKPTWGRVSRAGVFALAESLDHIGPMTRSAADAAAVLGAIAGPDPHDPTAAQVPVPDYLASLSAGAANLRIGIDRALLAAGADAEAGRVLHETEGVFSHLGARISDVRLPPLDEITRDAVQLCAAEVALAHEATFPARAGEYGEALALLIETGRRLGVTTLVRILHRRAEFAGRIAALFRDIDLLLLPAMNESAPTVDSLAQRVADPDARRARIRLTAPFDMSGSPCLTLPGGQTGNGVPIGFQLIGRHFEETLVLRAGHAFQQASDWHKRRPALSFAG